MKCRCRRCGLDFHSTAPFFVGAGKALKPLGEYALHGSRVSVGRISGGKIEQTHNGIFCVPCFDLFNLCWVVFLVDCSPNPEDYSRMVDVLLKMQKQKFPTAEKRIIGPVVGASFAEEVPDENL